MLDPIQITNEFSPLIKQHNQVNQKKNASSFVDTLKEFIDDVNNLQKESAIQSEKFIKGEPVDIHTVMITAEKAKTSFNLLLELRNKALELYREINRLQV